MDETASLRRTSLLEHFAEIKDTRQPCKVMYALGEVLLLVVCSTMAACDDYDDIVLWGNKHLDFLRGLRDYHFGIPCAGWLPGWPSPPRCRATTMPRSIARTAGRSTGGAR